MTFYNTIGIQEPQAAQHRATNAKQNDIILSLFQRYPGHLFTPFEVQHHTRLRAPITSIRRAITDLTKAGHLVKTDIKKIGKYGTVNYTWQLKDRQAKLF